VSFPSLRELVGDVDDLQLLYRAVREGGCKRRKKALAVIGFLRQTPTRTIARTLGLNRRTLIRYREVYRFKGAQGLLERLSYKSGKVRDEKTRVAVLSLLHSPPRTHNINRTTWNMEDLRRVLESKGFSLAAATIRKIIRATGFRWRKARIVLTSN